jgi:LmbE family N-acetylglucosaminyl deacetylase
MNKVLVVSSHPDDETLGCGGTILKHKKTGDKVYWLIMTNISVNEGYGPKKVSARQGEIAKVVNAYGFEGVFKLDYPTARLDSAPKSEMIKAVSAVIGKVKPAVIYVPNKSDIHSDHETTFNAVMRSAKTFRFPFIKRILMYETISETEFTPVVSRKIFAPNSFSDISAYLNRKIAIMKIYKSELGKHPFPRSLENIKALATFRGSTAYVRYAEAFVVLKEIW